MCSLECDGCRLCGALGEAAPGQGNRVRAGWAQVSHGADCAGGRPGDRRMAAVRLSSELAGWRRGPSITVT
ncbi:hypothetical protein GCM10010278_27890 [Streptomyces melanogenes]|nr:hypothetical protein GCM10010278_27890 [Streptomyces melanogenes]